MDISIDVIKELRDRTGVSIMQCRKALEEAEGDMDKAEVILRKRSGAAADKKADRELGAGTIGSYVHDGAVGAMVLLSSETDFVSKNEDFVALARDIAMHVAAANPTYLSDEDISSDAKEAAHAVFVEEVKDKPVEMQEKILEGKMGSYFKDQVLLAQPFIKDESKSIRDLLNEAAQKFGERVEISKFARFSSR
ncbi:elongation factor Ts [Patescibacteria group bacterium]|nr:elongation factor Ts [Patescibacteria group bacterium]MBU2159240.1 elongation factor Ts [Patescibacteria group bacterium]MBU2220641.1 elongation factor Ts [Patescibacteria group bacterium]